MFHRHLASVLGLAVAVSTTACAAIHDPASSDESTSDHQGAQAGALPRDLMGLNVATNFPGGAAIADLGAGWVRIELRDGSTGPELSPSIIDHYRATIDDYHAHGQQVLLVVDYTTHGGFGGGGTQFCPVEGDWEGWRSNFLARVGHAASVLGDRVDAWQVWNEPDHPCGAAAGYDPYLPPEVFGVLMRDAHGAIRGAGVGTPVVIGGLESGDPSYMDKMVAWTGGSLSDYADAVAIQVYGVVPNDSWCEPGGKAEGEFLNCAWGRLDGKVHEYFDRSGGMQVWVTEVGLRTNDPAKQADYLEDAHMAFASTGDRLARVFWFAYSDAMVAPFGLTDGSGSAKPFVYERYQMLTGALASGGDEGGDQGGEQGSDPGADPGSDPGSDPGADPGADPGSDPGSDPGAEPSSLSCGELAGQMGWSVSLCEWNGNGACGGEGTPTWDCDVCCGW